MTTNSLPLSRYKVLDLTRARAGPTCVRQLVDWGAEAIKIEVGSACPQAGQTIRELAIRRTTGAVVIAVRKTGGRFEITPDPDERIDVGDVVIAIGTEPELRALEDMFAPRAVGV